jgi:hypothetical protein
MKKLSFILNNEKSNLPGIIPSTVQHALGAGNIGEDQLAKGQPAKTTGFFGDVQLFPANKPNLLYISQVVLEIWPKHLKTAVRFASEI